MLERLIDSTYSAFDKDPHARAALRVQHTEGFTWTIRDRTLTASTETGRALATIVLRGITVAQLADRLTKLGCQIVYQNAEYSATAADALLAGSGRQAQANGDLLSVYSTELWALLDAYATMLEDATVDAHAAVQQVYLGTASEEWLDLWGSYFNILRETGEQDAAYRARILVETLRPRSNRIAIEKAIFDITGKRVTMHEFWRGLFRLDASPLSAGHHMADGLYHGHNTMQPQANEHVNWDKVLPIIERNRPAGTLVAPPLFRPTLVADAQLKTHGTVKDGREDVRSMSVFVEAERRLDVFALGDEGGVTKNYKAAAGQLIAILASPGLKDAPSMDATRRNIRRANIVLSDSDEVGAMNAVFQRDYWHQPPDFMTLSGHTALSAYEGRIELKPVNEITPALAMSVSFSDVGGAVAQFGIEEVRSSRVDATSIPTVQQKVGMEFTSSRVTDLSKILVPKPVMWGWGGPGSWKQETEIGWQENLTWGTGLPQS